MQIYTDKRILAGLLKKGSSCLSDLKTQRETRRVCELKLELPFYPLQPLL